MGLLYLMFLLYVLMYAIVEDVKKRVEMKRAQGHIITKFSPAGLVFFGTVTATIVGCSAAALGGLVAASVAGSLSGLVGAGFGARFGGSFFKFMSCLNPMAMSSKAMKETESSPTGTPA